MTKQLPDYYLYSANYRVGATTRFEVIDTFKFNEEHVLNCRRDLLRPTANIVHLLLEREYRRSNASDVRDVANGAWRIALDGERGPRIEVNENRTTQIRKAINRRLTLLEDEEYIAIYGK